MGNCVANSRSRTPSKTSSEQKLLPAEMIKVENINKHSFFEDLNYKLNVLVPLHEERELSVPIDSYLQQVHKGENAHWVRFLITNLARCAQYQLQFAVLLDGPQSTGRCLCSFCPERRLLEGVGFGFAFS
jgi:hypothetical protein